MRPSIRLIILAVALLATIPASVAAFSTTPHPPNVNLPAPDDTASFKMTISGKQINKEQLYRDPDVDGCTRNMQGTLDEGWAFQRSRSVVMEFRKYGHKVFLQRRNRQIGDSAFATTGQLRRDATGFMKVKNPLGSCLTYSFVDPSCGKTVGAPLDLRLDYSGGTLALKPSGPSATKPNPLEKCGLIPTEIGETSFNQLSNPYPFLFKEKGSLSAKQIFGKKKRFTIELNAKYLEPILPLDYTTFSQQLTGGTTVKLVRE